MKITKKMAQESLEVLEEVREEFFQEEKEKYPFSEWERKREQVKEKLNGLLSFLP